MSRTTKRTKRPAPPIDLSSAPILLMLFEDIRLDFLTEPFLEDGSLKRIRPTITEHVRDYFHGYYQGQDPNKFKVGRRREILVELVELDWRDGFYVTSPEHTRTFAEHCEALVEEFFNELLEQADELHFEDCLRMRATHPGEPHQELLTQINERAAAYK